METRKIKSFGLGAIAVVGLGLLGNSAIAQPLCYMVDKTGKMVDLTGICPQKRSQAGTLQAELPTATNLKTLVFQSRTLQTYVNLATLQSGSYTRRVTLERVFTVPQKDNSTNQTLRADVTCPNDLRITQLTSFDEQGKKVDERSGGDLFTLERREKQAVTQLVCSNNPTGNAPVSSPNRASTQPRSGVCNSPTDLDSRGRLCGNRAASRRPGGR